MHVSHFFRGRPRGAPLAIALAALAMIAPAARAASYSYFYKTVATTYVAAPGTPLTINVYLQEVDNANNPLVTTSLVNDDAGLAVGAFSVGRFGGTGTSTLAAVAPNVGVAPFGFDGAVATYNVGGVRSVNENVNQNVNPFAPGVTVRPVNPGGFNGVLLGTVTVTVGSGSTSFTVGPRANDATITNFSLTDPDAPYNLDDNTGYAALYESATSTTFTVTSSAVAPEPTTAALVTAAVALAARRRRRD